MNAVVVGDEGLTLTAQSTAEDDWTSMMADWLQAIHTNEESDCNEKKNMMRINYF